MYKKIIISMLTALMVLTSVTVPVVAESSSNITNTKGSLNYEVKLNGHTLRPEKKMNAPGIASVQSKSNEIAPYIIIFNDIVTLEMKDEVTKLGAKLQGYLPENAYIATMTQDIANKVGKLDFVLDIRDYIPEYKISPSLDETINMKNTKETKKVIIHTFDNNVQTVNTVLSKKGDKKLSTEGGSITVEAKEESIDDYASLKNVRYIEEKPVYKLYNNVAVGLTETEPIRRIGYEGEGQIVAVADTGLDKGIDGWTANILHKDLQDRVLDIKDLSGNMGIDFNGHGTHVAGSIVGNGNLSNGKFKGMAPKARLVFESFGIYESDGLFVPADIYNEIFMYAYNKGARIHSNSWGSPSRNYTEDAKSVDQFIWDHNDMTILVAAGNEGGYGDNTIGAPATAKNCITVGASENSRFADGTYSDNPNEIAFFSSKGWTTDGRIKPDVVAPGTNIVSTSSTSQLKSDYYNPYPGNMNYEYMTGTSMATPITAGSVAVVREYIQKVWNIQNPSASLIKAVLINGATDLGHGYPSKLQGWGKISLYDSLLGNKGHFSEDSFKVTSETDPDREINYSCTVTDSNMPLKLTLVWSDYPSEVAAQKNLVNDIDLKIISPSGKVYNGNDFSAPYDSETDRLNNVENVFINNPEVGTYTIKVSAHNIQYGPQPFSIVSSCDLFSIPKNLYTTNTLDSITVNWNSVPGASSYDIQVDNGNIYPVSGTTYLHSGLTSNSVHTYKVRAKDASKVGEWSAALTSSTMINTPENLQVSLVSEGIQFTWDSTPGAEYYDLWLNNMFLGHIKTNSYLYKIPLISTTYELSLCARNLESRSGYLTNKVTTYGVGIDLVAQMERPRSELGLAFANNKIYALGGYNGQEDLDVVEEYDITSSTWSVKNNKMMGAKSSFGTAVINGKVYIIGGSSATTKLNTLDVYDPSNDVWVSKKPMTKNRSGIAVAVLNNKIYAVGGNDGTNDLDLVEEYDPSTDSWVTKASMPTKRSGLALAAVGGKLYAIGGKNGTTELSSIEAYDPLTNKWTIKKNFPVATSGVKAIVLNEEIFILGGTNLKNVIKYTPSSGVVRYVSAFNENLTGNGLCAANGIVYAAGGVMTSKYSKDVLRFNPSKGGWTQKQSMPNKRANFAAYTIDGKLYAAGGGSYEETLNNVAVFDPQENIWIEKSNSPLSALDTWFAEGKRQGKNKLFQMGGSLNYSYAESVVFEYDIDTDTWSRKTDMPIPKRDHKTITLNNKIYVFGGLGNNVSNTDNWSPEVEIYDPELDSWTVKSNQMPTPRNHFGLAAIDGKIYVLGGYAPNPNSMFNSIVDTVEVYNPDTDTWVMKSKMPYNWAQFSTVVMNGKIIVINGNKADPNTPDYVQEYNPMTDTWTVKEAEPEHRWMGNSAILNNEIYSLGGCYYAGGDGDVKYSKSVSAYQSAKIPEFSIGNAVAEPRCGTYSIPVTFSNIPSSGIYSASLEMQFDPAKLLITGINKGQIIPTGTNINYDYDNSTGKLILTFVGDDINRITSNGVFANIQFDVYDTLQAVGTAPIQINKESSAIFINTVDQVNVKQFKDGSVDIFLYGDVNGDGMVTSADSSCVTDYLLKRISLFPFAYGRLAADVSGDGVIASNDYALIRDYTMGRITKFPVQN